MSANLDLVRSIYAAQERGDFTAADWAHPEIEYVIADGPSPATWTGLAEMAEGQRDFLGAWEDFRLLVDECRELDDERVLVLGHSRGRGKASGVELDAAQRQVAALYQVRDGRVMRHVVYLDRADAFADLGLAE